MSMNEAQNMDCSVVGQVPAGSHNGGGIPFPPPVILQGGRGGVAAGKQKVLNAFLVKCSFGMLIRYGGTLCFDLKSHAGVRLGVSSN